MKKSDTGKLLDVPRGYDVVITNLNDRLRIALVKNSTVRRHWSKTAKKGA
jgi:hypothetical protein